MSQPNRDAEKLRLRERIESVRERGASRRLVVLLRQAAALDDTDSLVELGQHCLDGLKDSAGRIVVKKSSTPALRFFRRAAELGDSNGMLCLANALERATFNKKTTGQSRRRLAEALAWQRKALKSGNPVAAFNLAQSYLNQGRVTEAVRRFRALAKAGDEDALLELAKAELYGVGMKRDVAGAVRKLKLVARKGSKVTQFDREQAMLLLASTAYQGWLMPRDFGTAVAWLRRAAATGSAAAKGLLDDFGDWV